MNMPGTSGSRNLEHLRHSRRAQSVVEYMLGVSVVMIAIALGFSLLGESAKGVFQNVRTTVQQPYP